MMPPSIFNNVLVNYLHNAINSAPYVTRIICAVYSLCSFLTIFSSRFPLYSSVQLCIFDLFSSPFFNFYRIFTCIWFDQTCLSIGFAIFILYQIGLRIELHKSSLYYGCIIFNILVIDQYHIYFIFYVSLLYRFTS